MAWPLIFAYAKNEGFQASSHLIKPDTLIFPVFPGLFWFQERGDSQILQNFRIWFAFFSAYEEAVFYVHAVVRCG